MNQIQSNLIFSDSLGFLVRILFWYDLFDTSGLEKELEPDPRGLNQSLFDCFEDCVLLA